MNHTVGLGWDDDYLYESRLQEAHDLARPRRFQEQKKLQGRREFQGLPISIENRVGSVRRGEKPDGAEWATKITFPYGYIRGTEGVDGDHLDCFIGPNEEAENAYVVHTKKPPKFKEYDEDKVMLGFDDEEEAKEAFLENYDDERFYGGMGVIPMEEFRKKAEETKEEPQKLVASLREAIFRHAESSEYGVKGMKWGERKGEEPESAADMLRRKSGEWQSALKKRAEQETPKKDLAALAAEKGLRRPDPKTPEEQEAAKVIEDNGMVFGGASDLGEEKLFVFMHDLTTRSTVGEFTDKITPEFVKAKKKEMHKAFSVKEARRKFRASVREAKLHLEEYGVKGQKWGVRKRKEKDFVVLGSGEGAKWTQQVLEKLPDELQNLFTRGQLIVYASDKPIQISGRHVGGYIDSTPSETGLPIRIKISTNLRSGQVSGPMFKDIFVHELGHVAEKLGKGASKELFDSLDSKTKTAIAAFDGMSRQRLGYKDNFEPDPREWLAEGFRLFVTKPERLKSRLPEVYDYFSKRISPKRKESLRESQEFGHDSSKKVRILPKKESGFREAKKRPRLYYARSLDMFESDREDEELELLEEMFPDHKIVFPSKKLHRKKGMPHFHNKVDEADLVVISPRKKNRLTAGVYSEARHAQKEGIPVKVLRAGKIRSLKKLKTEEGGRPDKNFAIAKVKKSK